MRIRSGFLLGMAAVLVYAQTGPQLEPKNVKIETATYKGRQCLRLTDANPQAPDGVRLAVVTASDFGDGTIEVDLAGDPMPGAFSGARGFVGIAFRLANGGAAYEAFYLRPTNGRAEDQERRNHTAQYISEPEFPWNRLRQETPSKYESYVDLAAGEWTRVKIEVHGVKARLYVNGAPQPVLIVNDLKHGVTHGPVAYWIGPGTDAHFAGLKITN